MRPSHSPSTSSLDHPRIARAAIRNGVPIPAVTIAVLQACGVDLGELENRVLATQEYQH